MILSKHQLRVFCVSGITLTLCFTSCSKQEKSEVSENNQPAPDETTVAMVGDRPVSFDALQRIAFQNGYDLTKPDERELALRDAVNFELLAIEAEKRGLTQTPEIQRYVKDQAVRALLADTVDKDTSANSRTVSEDELQSYYDEHIDEFSPPSVAKGRVLAILKRNGQETATEQKLDAVKQGIAAKQVPFSELIQQFSDDANAKNYGGVTRWLVQNGENKLYPKEVIDAVFAMDDTTTITGPLAHGQWIYFVQMVEKRNSHATPFDQAKASIRRQLERRERLEAYNQFVAELNSDTEVKTLDAELEKKINANNKSNSPPMGPVQLGAK